MRLRLARDRTRRASYRRNCLASFLLRMMTEGDSSWPADQQTPPSQSSSRLSCFLVLDWPKEAGPAVAAAQPPRAQRGGAVARRGEGPRDARAAPRAVRAGGG